MNKKAFLRIDMLVIIALVSLICLFSFLLWQSADKYQEGKRKLRLENYERDKAFFKGMEECCIAEEKDTEILADH